MHLSLKALSCLAIMLIIALPAQGAEPFPCQFDSYADDSLESVTDKGETGIYTSPLPIRNLGELIWTRCLESSPATIPRFSLSRHQMKEVPLLSTRCIFIQQQSSLRFY